MTHDAQFSRITDTIDRLDDLPAYKTRLRGMVGCDLAALRTGLGWSTRKAAREIGCDPANLSRIEKGTGSWSMPLIRHAWQVYKDAYADTIRTE